MEEVFFYHLDHLGTPLAMTRENKSLCWSSEYLPFGELFNEEGSETNELRFPGQYHDRETDRYYNWHRYYDPELGRYMQSDPLYTLGGRDWYSYAEDNPLGFIDPFGLCRQKNWWEKLEEGCYHGTGYGEEAVDWWARQYNNADSWYSTAFYFLGGVGAAHWTPETWMYTAGGLAAMGGAQACGLSSMGPWMGTFGLHQAHHGLGRHLELILRFGHKRLKVILPGKKDILFWDWR